MTDFVFFVAAHGWIVAGISIVGAVCLVGGIVLLRQSVTLGPDPAMPTVALNPPAMVEPTVAVVQPNHVPLRDWDTLSELATFVADVDATVAATTDVIARIPGATPEAAPVCPTCGGPFHAVCPSASALTIVIPPLPTEEQRANYKGRHREDGDTRAMAGSVARAKELKP